VIAQRCLYGVDKNPLAVDLAKLSLWLAPLAKDHPFTFLNHALRHGDSLVGLTRRQIESFHWKEGTQIETVGKLIEGKTPEQIAEMAFADIACGSGSFLIEVYDVLLEYHTKYYAENPKKAKNLKFSSGRCGHLP